MIRVLAAIVLWLCAGSAFAQFNLSGTPDGVGQLPPIIAPALGPGSNIGLGNSTGQNGGGSVACVPGTHATTFLARTSGLSGTETTAYCNLINGLDTDSTYSLLSALWITATNTTTTANLNLISTSFTLTATVPPTFTADQGYTGNGTTQFLNTNYIISTNVVVSMGVYIRGGRTTGVTTKTAMGGADASSTSKIVPLRAASQAGGAINDNTAPPATLPSNTANGFLSVVRTTSSAIAYFKNASSTALTCATCTSDAVASAAIQPIYLCASNLTGTAGQFTDDQISAAYVSTSIITGAQHVLLSNRINTYMSSLSTPINVY